MYQTQHLVRYADCDGRLQAKPRALITWLQETAVQHSEATGHGAIALQQRNLGWMLVQIQAHLLCLLQSSRYYLL